MSPEEKLQMELFKARIEHRAFELIKAGCEVEGHVMPERGTPEYELLIVAIWSGSTAFMEEERNGMWRVDRT